LIDLTIRIRLSYTNGKALSFLGNGMREKTQGTYQFKRMSKWFIYYKSHDDFLVIKLDYSLTWRIKISPGENFSQNFACNFSKFLYNFSEFLYNFITFSHFLYKLKHFSENLSQNFSYIILIIKYRKISKIFCKYNFWWNVLLYKI